MYFVIPSGTLPVTILCGARGTKARVLATSSKQKARMSLDESMAGLVVDVSDSLIPLDDVLS